MDRREMLAEIKRRLQAVHGERLKGVVLYGSMARGDAGPDSDVDVLVLLDDPVSFGKDLSRNLRAVFQFSLDIDHPISPIPVSATRYESYDCPLYRQVHKDGIRI